MSVCTWGGGMLYTRKQDIDPRGDVGAADARPGADQSE